MMAPTAVNLAFNKDYLSFAYSQQHGVLIGQLNDTHVTILHRRNLSVECILELKRHLQRHIILTEITNELFNDYLSQAYATSSQEAMLIAQDFGEDSDLTHVLETLPQATDLLENEDAPIIRLLNALFTQAVKQNASDIHIETFAEKMQVRFRIDGVLRLVIEPNRMLASLVVSRIKIMAKLDIAEKRLPQDGRISLKIAGRLIDVRVSILPSNHGERVVLRLLDQQQAQLDLMALGMSETTCQRLEKLIHKPHGLLLITGPTGSGKTTTLYAMLQALNDATRNILTVEDPIEYDLVGIGQTAVNAKIGLSFAKGLRAILRQDPDVVMIGEIRDLETAEIAIQASLTGHLVLSTLHTNTAVGAITRLKDMGIEPFLLSSCLLGVLAQRLVRLLCIHCQQAYQLTIEESQLLQVPSTQRIQQEIGCPHCHHTGYQGRSGIYELFAVNEGLRELIHNNANESLLTNCVRQQTASIQQDGFSRVLAGKTTLTEVLRVTKEEI